MASSPEEIAKHRKLYWKVLWTLLACTCITLALGIWKPLDMGIPGASWEDVIVGLLVACVKASLVALIFMHLNHEKSLIYKFLLFTFFFFLGLMCLSLFAWWDPIKVAYETVWTQGFSALK